MTVATFSCSSQNSDFSGCYDARQTPAAMMTIPAIDLTGESVDFSGGHWKRVISLDVMRPLAPKSFWRTENDTLYLYFGPPAEAMTDGGHSVATLKRTPTGVNGQMMTTTLYDSQSQIDLVPRQCEMAK